MLKINTAATVKEKFSENSDDSENMSLNVSPKQASLGGQNQSKAKPKEKRIRERHISEVVSAVAVWRRLYHGIGFF